MMVQRMRRPKKRLVVEKCFEVSAACGEHAEPRFTSG
jgi:hypothetical protein